MKKGFTLIEVMGVMILLSALALLSVPIVEKQIAEGRQQAYEAEIKTIELAAENWMSDNLANKPDNNETITIMLSQLKQVGYVKKDIKNPLTKQLFANDMLIEIVNTDGIIYYNVLTDTGTDYSEYDSNTPTLILNGKMITTSEVNQEYNDLGIVAKDSNGNIITEVDIQNNVNINQVGSYNVIYTVTHNGKTNRLIRTVNIKDMTSPTLTIPTTEIVIFDNELINFDLLNGVTATDNSGSVTIKTQSNLSIIPGDYTIKYIATDNSGNNTIKARLARVIKSGNPIFYVNNLNIQIIEGEDIDLLKDVYALDANGYAINDITCNIDGNSCNTSLLPRGNYIVTYIATDSNNKTTTLNRTLFVDGIVYVDSSGANKPELYDKMIPVIYENNNWVYADIKEKWYDYDAKQWANAVVLNDNIVDQSPNNNYGIPYGTGKQLDSRYFDGIDDYINAGLVSYDFQNKITIAARFKIHRLNEDYNECIFGNWENAGGGIFMTASGHYISTSLFVGGSYRYLKSSTQIELNKYYTVVLTYDGSIIKLYIDGELEQTMEITGNIGISPTPFALGANPTVSSANGFSNTTISDAVLYTNALTQTQIKTHFSNKIGLVSDNLLLKYDFSNQQNIKVGDIVPMERIGTMWVWVPRYKYTIFNGNNGSAPVQEINIVFESGTAKTGTVTCTTATSGSGSSSETCSTITNGVSTYTHPAFTFGTQELTGIWVGKFENSTTDTSCNTNQNESSCSKVLPVTIKPNVRSWRYANVSNFYTSIGNISNNYEMNVDSHMMKNMEWGAVAYLTQSKYGRCDNGTCTEIAKNDSSDYYTGRSLGKPSTASGEYSASGTYTYESSLGQQASITGNIYGIYDMSGGSWDFVMGNMVNSSNQFYSSSGGFSTNPITKYYDSYTYDESDITHSRGRLGDATKEILKTYGSKTGGWYGDGAYVPFSTSAWFNRGGGYGDAARAGVFYFHSNNGGAHGYRAARAVVVSADDN